MTSELLELAERMDLVRVWLFGRRWVFGPFSLVMWGLAAALRAIATTSTENG